MHLLYCDETNFEKTSNNFFVYGGISIKGDQAHGLSKEIDALRKYYSITDEFPLKFNPGPDHLSHQEFIDLKKGLIALAVKYECRLFVNLLLHDIATNSEDARRNGVNTLCHHFNSYLGQVNGSGLVIIDRFTDKLIENELREKLSTGESKKLPSGTSFKVDRIFGYHFSSIGQSHLCSLVDVLLGSLRFSINAFTENNEKHTSSATNIFGQLSPLFFRYLTNKVQPCSLWFSPLQVKHEAYRKKYENIVEHLISHGIEPQQKYKRIII